MSNCNDDSTIQIDLRRGPLTDDTYEVFVRYCSGGSWHYLCEGGRAWTQTLATVACRQLGYSDQGEELYSFSDNQLPLNYHLQEQCLVFWDRALGQTQQA